MVGSRQAAEDVTEELLTQLWLRPGGFDPDRGTLSAYLFELRGTANANATQTVRSRRSVYDQILRTSK
jgi:DNA-directed RNA polymerase specialized sigma24 family protein